jgi:hypothetical protein
MMFLHPEILSHLFGVQVLSLLKGIIGRFAIYQMRFLTEGIPALQFPAKYVQSGQRNVVEES